MDMGNVLSWIGFIPEKINKFILDTAINSGLAENLATRMSPLIYWIVVALLIWLTIAILEKINWIIKIIIFVLLALLIAGFFVPVW